jgi:hypothetical protein
LWAELEFERGIVLDRRRGDETVFCMPGEVQRGIVFSSGH